MVTKQRISPSLIVSFEERSALYCVLIHAMRVSGKKEGMMGIRATELTLDRLGTNVVSHANESLRSLKVIRAIEETISALSYDSKFYKEFADVAGKFAQDVRGAKATKPLDPQGKLEEVLARAQQSAKDLYDSLVSKRRYAEQDPNVNDEDCLVDEFTKTIAVLADLHNKLNELRWAVGEHDVNVSSDGDKNSRTFTSAEEVKNFLRGV